MTGTNLAQTIYAANYSGAAYDTNVKYLLSDKQILSRILKYTVEEFQEMEIEDIIGCIGNDIEVGTRPVDAGLSNLGRVGETVTEDNVPGEGAIFYDIRFTAYIREAEIKILVNIEAQKSSDRKKLGYHLENRIVFYLARMISAQKQTEFFHSDFDNLKKVRSIWIYMDNNETEDSIEEIGLDRKTVFGNKKNSYHTDLMKGIIVNIRNGIHHNFGEDIKKSENVLIAMLKELVSEKSAAEKKRILADEYGMIMTAEIEGRIQVMCNWSESVAEGIARRVEESVTKRVEESVTKRVEESVTKRVEESFAKRVEEGVAQRVNETVKYERLNAVGRMIKADITREQILAMGYTEDEYKKAESELYANV